MTAAYPTHREADVVLRDGSTVHIRPVRPEDEGRMLEFLRSLSQESLTLRFFSPAIDLEGAARRATQVDYQRDFALVAVSGRGDRIVGHGLYAATEADRAEVAFAIDDHWQGRGLGTMLLGQLAEVASANGIHNLEAVVMPTNHRMVEVFRESGFPTQVLAGFDELRVRFPSALGPEALERFERREQTAAVNALRTFLCPRSVAVIGASRHRGTIGGELFHNLLAFGFAGPVYPVNARAGRVQGVDAFPSVEAIPGSVDLAVVVVPSAEVIGVAEECGRKGVRALVVISAGFAEVGAAGRERQAELLRVCRAAGMRLIGPNCIGVINTDPAVQLNATFGPLAPPSGRVGFSSQSGALGLAAIEYASSLGLGLSSFVSVGNKTDVSGNDLLSYWESDPRTDVILLYLESFGNPRKFSRIARRVGRKKPIIAVKSGRSVAGARATASHTGALLAASDVTVDALFRQAGVVRTDTMEELFDAATLFANQPLPRGLRVGIVTNVGGPAILCTDVCEARGLSVPELAEESQAKLRTLLAPEASVTNPVDMIASATPDHFRKSIPIVGQDPNVDAVVAIFIPPLAIGTDAVARAIVDAATALNGTCPVLAVFMGAHGIPPELQTPRLRIPSYVFPESAAIALAHAAHYARWRDRPTGQRPVLSGVRGDEAVAIIARVLGRGGGWLQPVELAQLFSCYGLPLLEHREVASAEEAAAAARALGGAVALKAIAPGLVHKSEHGGVRLHLADPDTVRAEAVAMAARLEAEGHPPTGFLVQPMLSAGVEMIVGIVHDPRFGPVLACGAGGVMVELLKDVAVRLTPLGPDDPGEMLRELKTYPLLTGFRGSAPCDVAALEDLLLRVSALAEDIPQIAELDCNPVVVLERGVTVVDARVRVQPTEPPLPLGARRNP